MSINGIKRRGLMLVLSSPSGAGKTTISRELLSRDDNLALSVSATTRPKRPGETAGVDYDFIDAVDFNLMVNRRELLEHAKVFDHYYGTPRKAVEGALSEGRDMLFDIDWQGTQQLYQKDQQDVVRVFILPPSIAELRRRLEGRATDDADTINARMDRARSEISHWDAYDYVVINDDVEACFAKVREILHAERMKRQRQTGLIPFVRELMS